MLVPQFCLRPKVRTSPYDPYDTYKRQQGAKNEGEPHWKTLVRLLKETGGDGFNGDTMITMYKPFWDEGVAAGYPIVGEMELGGYPMMTGRLGEDTFISAEWSLMGWGYFNNASEPDGITNKCEIAPGIDKLKWLDSRRMTHVCDRWAKNRTDAMQYVFFQRHWL